MWGAEAVSQIASSSKKAERSKGDRSSQLERYLVSSRARQTPNRPRRTNVRPQHDIFAERDCGFEEITCSFWNETVVSERKNGRDKTINNHITPSHMTYPYQSKIQTFHKINENPTSPPKTTCPKANEPPTAINVTMAVDNAIPLCSVAINGEAR